MNRRTFLKITGIGSLSVAAGCTSQPDKTLYSPVRMPEDMVTGKATWYASTCRECPAGCGILAKSREGRITKLEGNPLHPINRGKLCPRGQAAIQGLYNPDRIRSPLLKSQNQFKPIPYPQAISILKNRILESTGKGDGKIRLMSEMTGKSLEDLLSRFLHEWHSPPPVIFEPYAYESQKLANREVFKMEGLPVYRMEKADFLLSFGADFLETWLSPVEYAIKFSQMRQKSIGKGIFFQIASYQGLTGANADRFIFCRPGGKVFIALRLMGELIHAGKGKYLPKDLLQAMQKAASIHAADAMAAASGISEEEYREIRRHLIQAKTPLVLGTSTGTPDPDSAATDMLVNCINLILDPALSCFDFHGRHSVERAAKRADLYNLLRDLETGKSELLFLNQVNPVFTLSPASHISELLRQESLFVVSFSTFMDETAALSDLVIPAAHPLERWDDYDGHLGNLSLCQPVAGSPLKGVNAGDVILQTFREKSSSFRNFKEF
ncbi:MAG: molybdopterin-dependent oxidoreductase, partial [Thermodesulfobacteriota bacterium]